MQVNVKQRKNKDSDERIKCKQCNDYTQSVEPIFIKRVNVNSYTIKAKCVICGNQKTKKMNQKQVKLLPPEIKDIPVGTELANSAEKNGGILPLAALIPLIIGGISAASGVASTVANVAINAKKNDEQARHNREIEKAAQQAAKGGSLSEPEIYEMINKFKGLGFEFI